GAVDVAVHRAKGDRAPAHRIYRIEARIAALEIRFACDRIQPFADAGGVHPPACWRIDGDATAAVEVERLADTARAVADERDGYRLIARIDGAARDELGDVHGESFAGGDVCIDHHRAGDDALAVCFDDVAG